MWIVFFFNDTATTEIYTLSLHDALPICARSRRHLARARAVPGRHGGVRRARVRDRPLRDRPAAGDRKSTRLNSSHANISYAVFCLKKKKHALLLPFFYAVVGQAVADAAA